MPDQIDLSTASQLFDTEVTLRLQNSQYLMDTIEERHGTTGIATNVPVSDQIDMTQGNFAPTDIPVTPVDETNVIITPTDWRVKTVIGGGQKTLFAYDKIVDHSKLHAKAAGRILDFIKLDAIFSNPNIGDIQVVESTIGVNTGMNSAKLTEAITYLESQGMDIMNFSNSLWMPATQKRAFFNDDRAVNFFYNASKPLSDYQFKAYEDTKIISMGENGINSIPYTEAMDVKTYLVPLVNRESIVQIFNRDVQTSITWVPQEDRWELLTVVTTGASIIQLNSLVLIECKLPFELNP